MIWTSTRKARKLRFCDDCHCIIYAGTPYVRHTAHPMQDYLDNETWRTMAQCPSCATRYGHMSADQAATALDALRALRLPADSLRAAIMSKGWVISEAANGNTEISAVVS